MCESQSSSYVVNLIEIHTLRTSPRMEVPLGRMYLL